MRCRAGGMNERVEKYLALTRELYELREKTGDADCDEEDALLELMDPAWAVLTADEIKQVETEIEKRWPVG